MFAKHLPPSAGLPRVLALDERAAAELAGLAQVRLAPDPDNLPEGPFDAIAGPAAPEQIGEMLARLRPGGRLIFTVADKPESLLAALAQAGLIHCLVEPYGPLNIYRGERPPEGSPVERTRALATGDPAAYAEPASPNYKLPITNGGSLSSAYIFLLVTQTPNKPAWKLAPGERLEWRAVTVLTISTGEPILLAFSSLPKAVAFMQGAVMARSISGVNKIGKFPAAAAQAWAMPLALNPAFDAIRDLAPGPLFEVDRRSAIAGDE